MSKIIFVTGGARSGKSAFAQELAAMHQKVVYVATAPITDTEMSERVRMHRRSRPENWTTVEAQKDIPAVFEENGHAVFLVDCLTVYISNTIVDSVDEKEEIIDMDVQNALEEHIISEIDKVVDTVRKNDAVAIIVSNEVGMGVVPAYPMGRMFRDIVGRANKRVALASDEAYLIVSGIPMKLKG